jgi:hypothetical protein
MASPLKMQLCVVEQEMMHRVSKLGEDRLVYGGFQVEKICSALALTVVVLVRAMYPEMEKYLVPGCLVCEKCIIRARREDVRRKRVALEEEGKRARKAQLALEEEEKRARKAQIAVKKKNTRRKNKNKRKRERTKRQSKRLDAQVRGGRVQWIEILIYMIT